MASVLAMVTPIRLLVVLLAFGSLPCVRASAQTRPDSQREERGGETDRQETAIDVARIRKLLAEQPPGLRPVQIPHFYEEVEVRARKPQFPTLAEQLAIATAPPPNPWASVEQILAVERAVASAVQKAQVAHPLNAIQKARGAWYRHKLEKTRREVEAELKAIKAAQ